MRCYKYIQGDINEDQSKFLPFDDNYMEYNFDEQRYTLTEKAYIDFLGESSGSFGTQSNWIIFNLSLRDDIYNKLLENPNDYHEDVVLFKIARTIKGRKAIQNAMINEARKRVTGSDFLNGMINKTTVTILRNHNLWKKGSYHYCVDPNELNVGY